MLNSHANLLDERGTLVLPDDVTFVKAEEFERMKDLKRLIGKNVEVVLYRGMSRCVNLMSVDFPNCTVIDDEAFADCDNLVEFNFGNKLKYIGQQAFNGCALDKVTITTDTLEIGYGAFSNCCELEKIVLNCNMPVFTTNAFYGSSKLTEVELNGNVEHIELGGIVYTNLRHLKVPSSTKIITTAIGHMPYDFDIEIPDDIVFDYDYVQWLYYLEKWIRNEAKESDFVTVNTNKGKVVLYDASDDRFKDFVNNPWISQFAGSAKLLKSDDE